MDNSDIRRGIDAATAKLPAKFSRRATRRLLRRKLQSWDKIMSHKVYRVELKIDFADDDRHQQMLELAKSAARDLFTTASMLQDGTRKPLIALITDDMFLGTEEININDPEGQ